MKKILLSALIGFCFAPKTAGAENGSAEVIFKAMLSEMNRSTSKLNFENFNSPYFLSYQMLDAYDASATARYGALTEDRASRNRYFYVELRYGNYGVDNTDENYRGVFDSAPLEDDEESFRHRLWLMTDQAYKQAAKDYLQKQGKKISEIEKDKAADFSREKSTQSVLIPGPPPIGLNPYKEILKTSSAKFKEYKEILDSGLSLRNIRKTVYHLNSEGTKIAMPSSGNPLFLYIWANAQAEDGMNLEVSRTFSTRSLEKLPSQPELKQMVTEIAGQLLKLREAPLSDPYTGPAILDAESTGVLVHEAVGHRLEGERQRDEEEGQTFKGQIGKQIIPPFLSVTDDPGISRLKEVDLNGHYLLDDEGVPAQKVSLIEKGVLKNYLMSRRPIAGNPRSNGHGRAQFGRDPIGRMANLFIESSKQMPQNELKKLLLEECEKQNKPYGIMIRRMRSGDTYTGRGRYQAFRGTPEEVLLVDAKTGKETLVRGLELVGTPLITVNKIIATGNEVEVSNAFCGAESGTVPITTVSPAALVKEIELQRVRENKQRPPILPAPLYEKE